MGDWVMLGVAALMLIGAGWSLKHRDGSTAMFLFAVAAVFFAAVIVS